MLICGLQKLAMVDYPGKLAATVFTGGCNLRCPFCHNALLVTRLNETPALPEAEVLDFLFKRRGMLDGVVISGGEPLLQADTEDFIKKVKQLGYAVKLDTNGCYPGRLERLLQAGLVDYVAMDIKNCPEAYEETCGTQDMDLHAIRESVRLLRGGNIEFEFRTTLVRELHTRQRLEEIGRWLEGAPIYVLQNFVDSGNLIKSGYHGFSEAEMMDFAALIRSYFGRVLLRGID